MLCKITDTILRLMHYLRMRTRWIPVLVLVTICLAWVGLRIRKARIAERKITDQTNAYRVAAERGDIRAELKLASAYYYGKGVSRNSTEAARWYRKAAEQGDSEGQCGLGYLYYNGEGVKQDYVEALRLYRQSAEQGYVKAQVELGYAYHEGKAVPQDYAQAVGWYRRAAGQGDPWGQDALGFAYYKGSGVPQDNNEAVRWYSKSAAQGFPRGQYDLGYMYYYGKGVPYDRVEASRLFLKAAKQGDVKAQRALETNLSTPERVPVLIAVLGSVVLLTGAHRAGGLLDSRQRIPTLAALLGLLWAGLTVYGATHLLTLEALSIRNAFYFAKHTLTGVCLAMYLFVLSPRAAKRVLMGCSTLLIALMILDFYMVSIRQVWHTAPPRLFSPAIGISIGMTIPVAISFWLENRRRTKGEKKNGSDASGLGATGTGASEL